MWTFDNKVAEIFPAHARQHIPNYDKVIQKTLDICADYSADSAIVDVQWAKHWSNYITTDLLISMV